MQKALLGLLGIVCSASAAAQTVYVRPHIRSDGTYVPGHHRTAPNSTRTDNWSSAPNVNPYNGRQGQIDPYRPQTPRQPQQRPPYSGWGW